MPPVAGSDIRSIIAKSTVAMMIENAIINAAECMMLVNPIPVHFFVGPKAYAIINIGNIKIIMPKRNTLSTR